MLGGGREVVTAWKETKDLDLPIAALEEAMKKYDSIIQRDQSQD